MFTDGLSRRHPANFRERVRWRERRRLKTYLCPTSVTPPSIWKASSQDNWCRPWMERAIARRCWNCCAARSQRTWSVGWKDWPNWGCWKRSLGLLRDVRHAAHAGEISLLEDGRRAAHVQFE